MNYLGLWVCYSLGLFCFLILLKVVIKWAVLEAHNEWEFELKPKPTTDSAESAFKK